MAHDNTNADDLKKVNQKLVAEGQDLPAVTMKDGSRLQTGTVAAMLNNVRRYDDGVRGDIERELELSVPTLFKVGLFDLFTPDEWVRGSSPGRRFVGRKALEHLVATKAAAAQ